MTHNEIIAKAEEIIKVAIDLFKIDMSNYDLSITTFNEGTSAGYCRSWQNKFELRFNSVIAGRVGEEFENTISHEIAHFIQKIVYPAAKQSHGPEFRMIHTALGGTGKTYHNYDVSGLRKRKVKRHIYLCGCQEHLATTQMHNKIQRALGKCTCKICSAPVVYDRTITLS